LNAELDDHLEGEAAEGRSNRRNGSSKKSVLTETAKILSRQRQNRRAHVEESRARRGEITAPALLLTTTGRKSGEKFYIAVPPRVLGRAAL
jgi:hypothetical protein